jgi:hypothetical protein
MVDVLSDPGVPWYPGVAYALGARVKVGVEGFGARVLEVVSAGTSALGGPRAWESPYAPDGGPITWLDMGTVIPGDAVTWAARTAYYQTDAVVPTVSNAHWYMAASLKTLTSLYAGCSGDVEPTWPTDGSAYAEAVPGGVIWQDMGGVGEIPTALLGRISRANTASGDSYGGSKIVGTLDVTVLHEAATSDSLSTASSGIAATSPSGSARIEAVSDSGGPRLLVNGLLLATELRASVALTSAQLLALHTSPIQVVDAPGAGYAIVPSRIGVSYHYETAPYSAVALELAYDVSGIVALTTEWDLSAGYSAIGVQPLKTGYIGAAADIGARALMATAASNPTGGDGVATLTVTYTIEPVP